MYTSRIIKCSLDQKAKSPAQKLQRPRVIWPTPSPVSSFTLLFSFPEPLQSFFLPQHLLSVTVGVPSPTPSPPNYLLISFKPPLGVTFSETLPCSSRLGPVPTNKPCFSPWLTLKVKGFVQCLTFPPNLGLPQGEACLVNHYILSQ